MSERPYSTRATHALTLADAAAARLGHPFVGTEHLLIGLLEERTGPAAQLLAHFGVTPDSVRAVWHEVTKTDL